MKVKKNEENKATLITNLVVESKYIGPGMFDPVYNGTIAYPSEPTSQSTVEDETSSEDSDQSVGDFDRLDDVDYTTARAQSAYDNLRD